MASAEVQVWGDNEQRIRTFQACFPASTESFLKPGRILVGEGVLLKQCRKKLKPRQVILFNDCVLYAVVVGKKKYGRPIMLNVNEMEATKVAPLRIVLRHPAQSITLQTSTEQEAADWEQHINMCIASQPKAEKQRPFAALWVRLFFLSFSYYVFVNVLGGSPRAVCRRQTSRSTSAWSAIRKSSPPLIAAYVLVYHGSCLYSEY